MPQTISLSVSVKDLPEVQMRLQQLAEVREKYLKLYAALAQHEPRINMKTGDMAFDVFVCVMRDFDDGEPT